MRRARSSEACDTCAPRGPVGVVEDDAEIAVEIDLAGVGRVLRDPWLQLLQQRDGGVALAAEMQEQRELLARLRHPASSPAASPSSIACRQSCFAPSTSPCS
jgi:hypothetical protein